MSLSAQPRPVISDGLPSQLPDIDPAETREWLDSLRGLVDRQGQYRARFLMLKLLEEARALRVGVPALRSTDYVNTIPTARSRRSRATRRWSAGSGG